MRGSSPCSGSRPSTSAQCSWVQPGIPQCACILRLEGYFQPLENTNTHTQTHTNTHRERETHTDTYTVEHTLHPFTVDPSLGNLSLHLSTVSVIVFHCASHSFLL